MRRVPPAASDLFVPCVLALLALAAGSSAPASPRETDSYRVLPGTYSRKDVQSGAGNPVARAALGELTIAVEFLDPGARAAFVQSIASAMPDPFAARPGRPEMYSVFRVSFNNRSGSDVQF